MITKAIIEEIVDKYHARVRIPTINKVEGSPSSTPFSELYVASVCCPIGSIPNLKIKDVVFVSFEDSLYNQPVIIGKLFREEENYSTSNSKNDIIDVNLVCNLPEETTIGSVTSEDILKLKGAKSNLQGQIDILTDIVNKLQSKIDNEVATKKDVENEKLRATSVEGNLKDLVKSAKNLVEAINNIGG